MMLGKKLFYYTSTDTATKILTNGEIWATNVRFMNDSEEFINGLKEIADLTNNQLIQESVNNLMDTDYIKYYTLSFCEREDALSQWFMYAKESGVSLEMNFDEYGKEFEYTLCENETSSKHSINGKIVLEKMIYCTSASGSMQTKEKEEAKKNIEKLLYKKCNGSNLKEVVRAGVIEAALLIKRYEFFQENEYRMIISVSNLPFESLNPVFYRTDHNVVKSYVKVRCLTLDKLVGWPISAVTIGPGFNQDVVFDSMKLFLDTAKICIPEMSHNLYVNRMKKYLYDAVEIIEDMGDRSKYKSLIDRSKWDFCYEFVGNTFNYQMHQYISEIFKQSRVLLKKSTIKELDKYLDRNYFSICGIVLKKSTIPYIF